MDRQTNYLITTYKTFGRNEHESQCTDSNAALVYSCPAKQYDVLVALHLLSGK